MTISQQARRGHRPGRARRSGRAAAARRAAPAAAAAVGLRVRHEAPRERSFCRNLLGGLPPCGSLRLTGQRGRRRRREGWPGGGGGGGVLPGGAAAAARPAGRARAGRAACPGRVARVCRARHRRLPAGRRLRKNALDAGSASRISATEQRQDRQDGHGDVTGPYQPGSSSLSRRWISAWSGTLGSVLPEPKSHRAAQRAAEQPEAGAAEQDAADDPGRDARPVAPAVVEDREDGEAGGQQHADDAPG